MSKPKQSAAARRLNPLSKGGASAAQKRGILDDRKVIEGCIAGDAASWSLLYERCHEPLLVSIRSFLREAAADIHLVDEVAARVWYSVVRNDCELLARFDVTKGCRLTTFLSLLARSEARQYFRAERRRRAREETAARREAGSDRTQSLGSEIPCDEFLDSLSPSERTYYEKVLIAPTEGSAIDEYTAENSWQLRHRVRKKLFRYLEDSD